VLREAAQGCPKLLSEGMGDVPLDSEVSRRVESIRHRGQASAGVSTPFNEDATTSVEEVGVHKRKFATTPNF
jgi:hypothetical protein